MVCNTKSGTVFLPDAQVMHPCSYLWGRYLVHSALNRVACWSLSSDRDACFYCACSADRDACFYICTIVLIMA